MDEEMTSIKIPVELRETLKQRKIHRNQPYYEIIRELLEEVENES